MAKKKKARPLPPPTPTAAPTSDVAPRSGATELRRHPTLALSATAALFAALSAALAFHFRDDMNAGALREPTSLVLWTAIAATLFASYWRERGRSGK